MLGENTLTALDAYNGRGRSSSSRAGAVRVNGDRVVIAGTSEPWIYASGYRGLRRAELKLDFLPGLEATKRASTQVPKNDVLLAPGEWPD